jgi:hypothetical protein
MYYPCIYARAHMRIREYGRGKARNTYIREFTRSNVGAKFSWHGLCYVRIYCSHHIRGLHLVRWYNPCITANCDPARITIAHDIVHTEHNPRISLMNATWIVDWNSILSATSRNYCAINAVCQCKSCQQIDIGITSIIGSDVVTLRIHANKSYMTLA